MNSALSLVSGQFTRSLIFGAFFPVVLFLVVGVLAVDPLLPSGLPIVQTFQNLDSKWEILALSFVAIVLTVFLYNLNIPIVRCFEGYPWRLSSLGRLRTKRYQRSFLNQRDAIPRLRMLIAAWKAVEPDSPAVGHLQRYLDQFGRSLLAAFPGEPGLILPTRFGNVVRAFESYPRTQYGMDGVTFWPRLVSAVPKDSLSGVDEARSSVDFFINGCVLSAILTAILFVVGCSTTSAQTPVLTLIRWPLETVAAAICTVLFYEGAVNRAAAWGGEVKSMFDLYRWDLLKKLGYQQAPAVRKDEREVWQAIGKQMQFGDPAQPKVPLAYKNPEVLPVGTSVASNPPDLDVELSGGVESIWWGRRRYIYNVRNVDAQGRAAVNLKLTIVLPGGVEYLWNSATMNGEPCPVRGLNPLVLDIGPAPPNTTIDVAWLALRCMGSATGKEEKQ